MDLDRTTRFASARPERGNGRIVTFFDAQRQPFELELSAFGKGVITFGRDESNDIVLTSKLVSHNHGRFVFTAGRWVIQDNRSTNGLIYNNTLIRGKELNDGDFIRIDDGIETMLDGVLMVISNSDSSNVWRKIPLSSGEISIGRDKGCTITLPHVSVSKYHASIVNRGGQFYIIDNNSTNGVVLNNMRVRGRALLHEKDIIAITNSKLIFSAAGVYYCCYRTGISVDSSDVVIKRGKKITGNHISLNIKPGELVAIIGGSGAGKSTILNSLCGYLKPASGNVYINGIDLYKNYDSVRDLIGYVPQSDIVYDNLTLYDMLKYTANLRFSKDVSKSEREAAISRVIDLVELPDKRNSLIRSLSGGQRKRASIAVELLSDPNLMFLDEPASGLDPGTERNLMQTLRNMADNGKTIILVTHSTLQLKLCDKIVFMGRGGNLCFFGSHDEALEFFGVSDIVDVYNMITDQPEMWKKRFEAEGTVQRKTPSGEDSKHKNKINGAKQLGVLCARYTKLIFNDKQRLLLLMAQAPLLAVLISLVADGEEFVQYEATKSLLFALSCSAFWVGMLNAIQEICKERVILKREFMAGLSLNSYVLSKLIVLGGMCFIQSAMETAVFYFLVGVPETSMFLPPIIEIFISMFLTAVASAAMGLFVSSLFNNADRAMTVAPILLMPQILFSGLIFKLSGATEIISWFATCRWSMEGLGTTADLNSLVLKLEQQGIPGITHEAEKFFDFTAGHMWMAWGMLAAFIVVFLALARFVLSGIRREKG